MRLLSVESYFPATVAGAAEERSRRPATVTTMIEPVPGAVPAGTAGGA
jgi:hypothetical protein